MAVVSSEVRPSPAFTAQRGVQGGGFTHATPVLVLVHQSERSSSSAPGVEAAKSARRKCGGTTAGWSASAGLLGTQGFVKAAPKLAATQMSASTRNLEAYGVEEGVCGAVRACAGHGGAEESFDGSASARQCSDGVRLCLGACETPRDRSGDGTSFICVFTGLRISYGRATCRAGCRCTDSITRIARQLKFGVICGSAGFHGAQ